MSRSREALTMLSLLFAGGLLSPAPAAAGFVQQWNLSGWDYLQEVGNTDGDPQRELLFSNKADGHLAIVDGLTGVIGKEFPDFTASNGGDCEFFRSLDVSRTPHKVNHGHSALRREVHGDPTDLMHHRHFVTRARSAPDATRSSRRRVSRGATKVS